MLSHIITDSSHNGPPDGVARRVDFEIPEALCWLGNGPLDSARPAADVLQGGVLPRHFREGVEQEPHEVPFARRRGEELVREPVGTFEEVVLDGKATHDFSLAGASQDVPHEGPVHVDGQAQFLRRDVGKLIADVLQDGLPVLAALRVVTQLPGHDDDVLDCVVEVAHGVRRDGRNPPRRNRGRELRDAVDVETL